MIEKGQADAIRTVRRATSGDPTALLDTTQNEQQGEGHQQSQPVIDNQRISSLLDEDVPNNLLEEEFFFSQVISQIIRNSRHRYYRPCEQRLWTIHHLRQGK